MSRGRISRALRRDQIEPLQKLRMEKRWGYQQLKMGLTAPCTAETLHRALDGKPVWEVYHSFLAQWVERYFGVPVAAETQVDYKSKSANDDTEGSL